MKKYFSPFVSALFLLGSSCSMTGKGTVSDPDSIDLATDYAKVDHDLSDFDLHIRSIKSAFAKNPANPNDKEWVKAKLAYLFEMDQYMRKFPQITYERNYSEQERKYFTSKFNLKWPEIDKECTSAVKELLRLYEWFKISEFGVIADNNAWVIVQHADLDVPFQKKVLDILRRLYPLGETSRSNFAYLEDRVAAIAERKPQRFGTQGKCVGPGQWEPHPIQDPANIDRRRKEMGLGTIAEYKTMFKDICKHGE